jgi:hypothetical protein
MKMKKRFIVSLGGWEYKRYWTRRKAEHAIVKMELKHDIPEYRNFSLTELRKKA